MKRCGRQGNSPVFPSHPLFTHSVSSYVAWGNHIRKLGLLSSKQRAWSKLWCYTWDIPLRYTPRRTKNRALRPDVRTDEPDIPILVMCSWSQCRIKLQRNLFKMHGLVVTCLTAVWEDRGSNPTVGSCVFIVNITTIYSLGHGLHTPTAVPRSTQPSTLRGMVKWVLAFGLSNNNNWRWCVVWLLAAYRRTHSPGRLAWSEGRRPLGAVPHSSWTGELSQWLWATMTAP